MQQRPQLVMPRRLPPAVAVDTAKCSFDLPSFCHTFDVFRLHFDSTNLWLNFPLKSKINPLAKMVSFDTGNAQCHENNETGRDTTYQEKDQASGATGIFVHPPRGLTPPVFV
jgi:hypothetical protein